MQWSLIILFQLFANLKPFEEGVDRFNHHHYHSIAIIFVFSKYYPDTLRKFNEMNMSSFNRTSFSIHVHAPGNI